MLQWVYWTPDFSQIGSYKITHVSPLVSPLVTTFFSKTGHEIILIFGMKLHIDSRKNVTEPFLVKNSESSKNYKYVPKSEVSDILRKI